MKNIIIALVVLVVGVAAFFAGRMSDGDSPGKTEPAAVAESAPAAPVPSPAPAQAAQAQAQAQAGMPQRAEVFPVSPMSDRPVPRQIAIPAGTKPARDASASKGSKDAPVVFIEISDFQCPVCKRAHNELAPLLTDFPDQVRYVFKHNPLEMHRDALNASAASLAAGRQGRFWEYADALFADQRALSEPDLMAIAQRLKLDMKRFKADYEDPALRQRAKTEGDIAMAIGARGTPAFLVNGRLQVGWASYAAVRQQVEQELAAMAALTSTGKTLRQAREERVRTMLPEAEKLLNTPLGIELTER